MYENNKLYVGNISYEADAGELTDFVKSEGCEGCEVALIEGKGFAFLTFQSDSAADSAMESLQGKEFRGRPLKVSKAIKRENRERDRGFSGGGGGRGGRGGGYNRR